MKPSIIIFCLCALLFNASPVLAADDLDRLAQWDAANTDVVDHGAFGQFLSDYAEASRDGVNRVRYAEVWPEDRQRLDGYIQALAAHNPTQLNRNEAFAFWVNLYNALTVRLILDHYPVKSIREIKPHPLAFGPWKMELVTVAGVSLTLDDIEHGILRAEWGDATHSLRRKLRLYRLSKSVEMPVHGGGT